MIRFKYQKAYYNFQKLSQNTFRRPSKTKQAGIMYWIADPLNAPVELVYVCYCIPSQRTTLIRPAYIIIAKCLLYNVRHTYYD